jgi:diacylglycerol kinase family enzyme
MQEAYPDMTSGTRKVAVILNRNARRYTDSLITDIARIIPKNHIWATGSLADARNAVGEILAGGFDVVFAGGGDGTIVTTVSTIRDLLHSGHDYPVPPIGILKLGTGNAWTYAVGVKGGLGQLAHVVRGGYFFTAPSCLIDVGGLLCPFAGMGWDAHILNDYYDLNKHYERSILAPVMKNLFGYFAAAVTRTIPKFVEGANIPEVEVTFTGRRLYKPDRRGNYFPITDRENTIIYHGPASIVAAGTIPYFGYKLRAFPYAGKVPGTMHLRVVNLDPGDAVRNLHRIWRGTYFSSDIIDFLADGIRITSTEDQPIEIGGDPGGYARTVDFTVSDFTVTIVAFWGV